MAIVGEIAVDGWQSRDARELSGIREFEEVR